jgi:hypothetical protein
MDYVSNQGDRRAYNGFFFYVAIPISLNFMSYIVSGHLISCTHLTV